MQRNLKRAKINASRKAFRLFRRWGGISGTFLVLLLFGVVSTLEYWTRFGWDEWRIIKATKTFTFSLISCVFLFSVFILHVFHFLSHFFFSFFNINLCRAVWERERESSARERERKAKGKHKSWETAELQAWERIGVTSPKSRIFYSNIYFFGSFWLLSFEFSIRASINRRRHDNGVGGGVLEILKFSGWRAKKRIICVYWVIWLFFVVDFLFSYLIFFSVNKLFVIFWYLCFLSLTRIH